MPNVSKDKGRVVIIGGNAAGMSAASKIRREQPERDILVLEKTAYTSYSNCGIPYLIGGLIEQVDSLVVRSPQKFREKYNIDVRTGHKVVEINLGTQRVKIQQHGSTQIMDEPYDQLLIATGARPFCPPVPGLDASGIFGLSGLASGVHIQDFLAKESPKNVVVVGGGYIGLEMAEALTRLKLNVSLVQKSPEVMDTLDPDMGALVSQALRNIGVNLFLSEGFEAFEVKSGRVTGVITPLRTLPADMVILGLGVRPNSDLAKTAGIELGPKEAISVDGRMQTKTANVWAAGDCATSLHRVTGQPVHIALGTIANKHGLVAGTNLSGGEAWFPGVVGTAVSKICAVEVARTGLQEKELHQLGTDYATATIKTKTRAGYYPGSGSITVKMLGEKSSGRLLGAQIVGMEGAAKRIDIIATALTAGMTVEDIISLDLSYAPPFSPVWDPVQTVARQLVKKL
ncbi:MAG: FAD-dependent oxidoreductase [Desulfuromonadaceae bacterium]|nr:FAD-dependent oxidoreductase [Desulfuromonadaceae bacterium]